MFHVKHFLCNVLLPFSYVSRETLFLFSSFCSSMFHVKHSFLFHFLSFYISRETLFLLSTFCSSMFHVKHSSSFSPSVLLCFTWNILSLFLLLFFYVSRETFRCFLFVWQDFSFQFCIVRNSFPQSLYTFSIYLSITLFYFHIEIVSFLL